MTKQNPLTPLFLIIGLGNPGIIYKNNRHNAGRIFIDWFRKYINASPWKPKSKLSVILSNRDNLILAKTLVFMNNSGDAVKKVSAYYKIPSTNIIIVQDDSDIFLGKYKVSFNRGSAGHKGINSIIQNLKTKKFYRIRIGIRSPSATGIKAEKLVLRNFTPREKKVIVKIFPVLAQRIHEIIKKTH